MLTYISEHRGESGDGQLFDDPEKRPDFIFIYDEDNSCLSEPSELEDRIKGFHFDRFFPIKSGVVQGVCTEKGGGGGFGYDLFETIYFGLKISIGFGITSFLNGLFSEAGKDLYSFLKEKIKKENLSLSLDRGSFWFLSGLSGEDIEQALRMIPDLKVEYGTFVYDVHQNKWIKIN